MPSISSSVSKNIPKPGQSLSSKANAFDDNLHDPAEERRDSSVLIANDDDPSFPKFWREGAKAQKKNLAITLVTGALIGIILSIITYAITNLSDPQTGTASTLITLTGLIASGLTLALLVFVIGRISGLAGLIDRVSEFEKNLNKSGRVAALTRELEIEAAQIETRIEQFLATGTGLRQELHREAHQINQLFSEKIDTVRHTIRDLDEARTTFLNEVVYINQAIEIARDFMTAKIGSLTQDFENAALSGAKVLELQMHDIAEKIKATIYDSRDHSLDLDKLISTNEKLIEIMSEAQNGVERQIEALSSKLNSTLEGNVNRTTAEIEILSQRISSSSDHLISSLAAAPLDIETRLSTLGAQIASRFVEQSANLATQIESSVAGVDSVHQKLHALVTQTPQIIEAKLGHIEPILAETFEKNIDTLHDRIERATTALGNSNVNLIHVLEEAPRKLEAYLARLTPTITGSFRENILVIETQMAELLQKQSDANAALMADAKHAVHRIAQEFSAYEPLITGTVDAGVGSIKIHLDNAESRLQSIFDEFRSGITQNNDAVVNEIHGAISGQISQIRVMSDHIRSDLHKTVSTALDQQNIDIRDLEAKFGAITENIRSVIVELARSTTDFGGTISDHIKALDVASAQSVDTFSSALQERQAATVQAISSELGQAQRNFVKEYSLTEERLFRSLSNLNEVVQNCIASLEESINWRHSSFDEQIKKSAEHNLAQVQNEVENLLLRMQGKIKELNVPFAAPHAGVVSEETVEIEPVQDPDLILGLSRQMANINAILNDMRTGVKK